MKKIQYLVIAMIMLAFVVSSGYTNADNSKTKKSYIGVEAKSGVKMTKERQVRAEKAMAKVMAFKKDSSKTKQENLSLFRQSLEKDFTKEARARKVAYDGGGDFCANCEIEALCEAWTIYDDCLSLNNTINIICAIG